MESNEGSPGKVDNSAEDCNTAQDEESTEKIDEKLETADESTEESTEKIDEKLETADESLMTRRVTVESDSKTPSATPSVSEAGSSRSNRNESAELLPSFDQRTRQELVAWGGPVDMEATLDESDFAQLFELMEVCDRSHPLNKQQGNYQEIDREKKSEIIRKSFAVLKKLHGPHPSVNSTLNVEIIRDPLTGELCLGSTLIRGYPSASSLEALNNFDLLSSDAFDANRIESTNEENTQSETKSDVDESNEWEDSKLKKNEKTTTSHPAEWDVPSCSSVRNEIKKSLDSGESYDSEWIEALEDKNAYFQHVKDSKNKEKKSKKKKKNRKHSRSNSDNQPKKSSLRNRSQSVCSHEELTDVSPRKLEARVCQKSSVEKELKASTNQNNNLGERKKCIALSSDSNPVESNSELKRAAESESSPEIDSSKRLKKYYREKNLEKEDGESAMEDTNSPEECRSSRTHPIQWKRDVSSDENSDELTKSDCKGKKRFKRSGPN